MRFTKARDLVPAAIIGAVVGYLALRQFYGDLPPLPRLAGITLLVLAIVEALFGFGLRSRIKAGKPIQALSAARAVALAKASSLLGAIMLGAWLGVLGYVVPESAQVDAARHDVASAVVGVVCAAALIGGALWLEFCCRTPPDHDDQRRPSIG
ncbi:DUF3180 domain-containing protein [Actinokineospora diospyrosa]|uniref:DUF3180 domain-containing protein n=1 Tax=Actinokineospora diospyrosa TaxID=103728 RepID=A0ABT1IDR4_9PSEU|nr:DUF3180 domain-containing protein [Actinokineospora diospyrosa]MCP2270758.1 Protein of unknown function (DUF3180) [Actinokineospora diospyrosa]